MDYSSPPAAALLPQWMLPLTCQGQLHGPLRMGKLRPLPMVNRLQVGALCAALLDAEMTGREREGGGGGGAN